MRKGEIKDKTKIRTYIYSEGFVLLRHIHRVASARIITEQTLFARSSKTVHVVTCIRCFKVPKFHFFNESESKYPWAIGFMFFNASAWAFQIKKMPMGMRIIRASRRSLRMSIGRLLLASYKAIRVMQRQSGRNVVIFVTAASTPQSIARNIHVELYLFRKFRNEYISSIEKHNAVDSIMKVLDQNRYMGLETKKRKKRVF